MSGSTPTNAGPAAAASAASTLKLSNITILSTLNSTILLLNIPVLTGLENYNS